jgi:hypothetical protein
MQCACATFSSVAYPTLKHISKVSHTQHDFPGGGGESLNLKCMFGCPLQRLSETFLILRRTERDDK